MGNTMVLCCQPNSFVKLIFWEGTTRTLTGKTPVAGEIMFEFPDRMVFHADSFFIGQPVPALAIDDELITGQTYFVLPINCFTSNVLSASSFAALVSSTKRTAINFKDTTPFQYMKGSNGKALIKVSPEFMISCFTTIGKENDSPNPNFLCSTPELKKHYDMLVGSKDQVWSPKLDTISEYRNIRFSPGRFLGFEWKKEEHEHM